MYKVPISLECTCTQYTNFKSGSFTILFIYPQIFQPYAKHWLTVLSQFIISAEDGMGGGEMGLNYFIVDIIATMLSWSGTAIIEVSIHST